MRLLLSLICSVAIGSIPYIVYWMGGGNFERGYTLGFTTCSSFILMIGGFIVTQALYELNEIEGKINV